MRPSAKLLFLLVAVACSCARLVREQSEVVPRVQPDPIYEELFPYYVELCAVSQFRSLTKGVGGVPGHAVMYLKGACKDTRAPHPTLRSCRRLAISRDDPEHGVGISVNRWTRNVNWLAIPGTDLFYEGGLEEGEVLSHEALDAAIQASIDAGVFEGVVLDPGYPSTSPERSSSSAWRTLAAAR